MTGKHLSEFNENTNQKPPIKWDKLFWIFMYQIRFTKSTRRNPSILATFGRRKPTIGRIGFCCMKSDSNDFIGLL